MPHPTHQQLQPGYRSPQQQQQVLPTGVCKVGCGKAASLFWLMHAEVTPWSDADSLRAWARRGAILQQQQQQAVGVSRGGQSNPQEAAAAVASGGQGGQVTLTVDGQEMQPASVEALVQQLVQLTQQQQQQ